MTYKEAARIMGEMADTDFHNDPAQIFEFIEKHTDKCQAMRDDLMELEDENQKLLEEMTALRRGW